MYKEPGSLGLTIINGTWYCTVTAITNVNKNSSLFQVGDVIISCNGYRYDSMIRLEEGEMAWLNYLRTSGVKCFVVQRQVQVQGDNAVPLKDISNAQKLRSTGSASSDTTCKNESLLNQVELQWRSGKRSRQTSACKAAIRSCLLNGISPAYIAHRVTKGMTCKFQQETERVRVRDCVKRIQAAGNAALAATTTTTTTKATDVEDLLYVGIPFQQNGVVYKTGDKAKKRKLLSDEATPGIHGKLDVDDNVEGGVNLLETEGETRNEAASIHGKSDSSVTEVTKVASGKESLEMDEAKLRSMNPGTGATAAAASLDNASDAAIITPSNSMEEEETNITSSGGD